jgi:hypothetical protein
MAYICRFPYQFYPNSSVICKLSSSQILLLPSSSAIKCYASRAYSVTQREYLEGLEDNCTLCILPEHYLQCTQYPKLVPNSSQINTVYTTICYSFGINFNIIFPYSFRPAHWLLYFRFRTKFKFEFFISPTRAILIKYIKIKQNDKIFEAPEPFYCKQMETRKVLRNMKTRENQEPFKHCVT